MDMELYFPNMTSTLQISGCGFGVKPPGWSYPNHHHHLFELLYCYDGEAVHYTNGMATPLREGDWIWIKSGVKHRMENASDAPYSFFNVHFDIDDPELRKTLSGSDYGLLTGSEAKRTKLPGYMERIEQLMSDGMTKEPQQHSGKLPPLRLGPATKIELQACILLLIHQITGYVAERQPLPTQHVQPVSAASALETDIAHAVEERLQQMALAPAEQTITQIADQLHISRSQCTKTFTKVYGVSPRRYVSRLIENRAKLLLVTTSMSVEDISLELGFRSLSHFSRQFRRWTGVSPMQYRPKRE